MEARKVGKHVKRERGGGNPTGGPRERVGPALPLASNPLRTVRPSFGGKMEITRVFCIRAGSTPAFCYLAPSLDLEELGPIDCNRYRLDRCTIMATQRRIERVPSRLTTPVPLYLAFDMPCGRSYEEVACSPRVSAVQSSCCVAYTPRPMDSSGSRPCVRSRDSRWIAATEAGQQLFSWAYFLVPATGALLHSQVAWYITCVFEVSYANQQQPSLSG